MNGVPVTDKEYYQNVHDLMRRNIWYAQIQDITGLVEIMVKTGVSEKHLNRI
ncbi:hypothetical protein M422DRAFT_277340 [Sphaerobolus stellatus SS14]|uniref:Uncharacterized protein n=1 Tax=Sphaerobolus stellatus (strain SS14) TaxID=990650 RepID=A0A0C9U9R3_SPHS4|nr:hypothetical protein M422DRAFT_277340 [Sphaerobolus stellatus SS14]